ncbi:hypothetical protein [Oceanitalea stevensii]|uniref:Uncharacterized protein n=1 Tax=Oceanitalea stevensii TaxID=2763072 RepID=A0ABR8YZE8_9MICO|nr:hypothetical protein [Oceanitalea stevensii]MBD8061428.1 hypothetical protein [Oceanitalea stevensii]
MEVDAEEVNRIVAALRGVTLAPRAGAVTDAAVAGQELSAALTTTEATWAAELATQDAALAALADFLVSALETFTAVDESLATAAAGEGS